MAPSPSDHRFGFLRAILIIRLINAFWVTTFFQPDEYFQALEPAWNIAFGSRSGAWLTWEWHHQLRSSIHPAIFSAGYLFSHYVSKVLPIGETLRASIVVSSPRVVQAVFAALGDWYTWQLAVKLYPQDNNVSSFALFLQLFNVWQWYCSVRTFSNSLETTLTIMALYYFPWHELLGEAKSHKENPKPATSVRRDPWPLRASLLLAAVACILRPTNGLIWAPIVVLALTRIGLRGSSPLTVETIFVLFREIILCGSAVIGVSLVADRLYYGFWTFPPYNFLYFNLSKALAVFYGRNPWHYYLLQGLPLLSITSLPFTLYALYKPSATTNDQANILRTLSSSVYVSVIALSVISHKEVRFIYPLLPILNILAAPYVASFFTTSATPNSAPETRRKPLLYGALIINIILAGYLSLLHQAGTVSVLSALRTEYSAFHPSGAKSPTPNEPLFALFLMPCHSTPWRSHLFHPSLNAYALSCEPPLHTEPNSPERDNYRDEADRFYDDPLRFLSRELFSPDRRPDGALPAPRYIVGFEGIEPWLQDFAEATPEGRALGLRPRRVWSAFNGFFNEDHRRAGRVVVWDTGVYGRTPQAETPDAAGVPS
ncbi:unnamed protein product [Clonostachys byssicola]|uniref:Mannosyltransferase n=1 Tax=Clonostachys byssicola TaxID=160290 RepID=A0A9N9UU18_9HYPO|nr:unnamed protein product [Clonostachys byssicola]